MPFSNKIKPVNERQPDHSLRIVNVTGRRARNAFVRLPWSLYGNDPAWVPPLLMERRQHFSPKNPYFEHAACCFWLAYRDGNPVGRISAQVDRLHLERYRDGTGFWGMLEAEDNIETFQALFNTAEAWLFGQGMDRIRGPFSLSINDECGLLIDGFDTPPSVMMGHAHPYYGNRVEQCGYSKIKDILAYRINGDFTPSGAMKTIIKRSRNRVKTRTLRISRFQEELNIILNIYNDAWSNNWGFVPFTRKEFDHLGKGLKLLINKKLVCIAEVDGVPAAFNLVLPNLNEVIRDLDGRLLPFGWLKIFWRLKVKFPQTARIPLMGIRRRYHDSMLGAALAYRVIGDLQDTAIKLGIKTTEASWILENNTGMRGIIEDISGRAYKTYRIYQKDLKTA